MPEQQKTVAVLNLVSELLPVVVSLIAEAKKLAEGASTRSVQEILDEADRNALSVIDRAKIELAKLG